MNSSYKKYIFIILCFFLIAPLKATHCERDSLRLFLENIGEDSVIISQIISSLDTITPNRIVDNYLSLLRLKFNQSQQQYECLALLHNEVLKYLNPSTWFQLWPMAILEFH